MYRAIILDPVAINYIQLSGNINKDWLDEFNIAEGSHGIRRAEVNNCIYLLSSRVKEKTPMVIINLDKNGIFSLKDDERLETLNRAMRAGLSVYEASINIPASWFPYKSKSIISFRAVHSSIGKMPRLFMETNPDDSKNAYVFAIDTDDNDIDDIPIDISLFRDAIKGKSQAQEIIAKRKDEVKQAAAFGLELNETLTKELTKSLTLDQWYKRKLTAAQRQFVDSSNQMPLRLKGPAGTGKTLAMVIKCLRTLHIMQDKKFSFRAIFLTHSMATVEIVRSMMIDLDDRGLIYSQDKNITLQITTLQDLANISMKYDFHNISPLSNDGMEGRLLQLELISSIIEDMKDSDWPAYEKECTDTFKKYLAAKKGTPENKFICWEIMNEFACVLDAEGLRDTKRQNKYLEQKNRPKWMMHLETKAEREVILNLYRRFREQLQQMGTIGVDQMISDYLGFLDSFRWDSIRTKEGYDIVFVDELHLFNRQERMVFHFLLRDSNKNPSVFMAYDAKQSPRDTFVGAFSEQETKYNYWSDANLGVVDKIELKDVFRYTPEIANALSYIDQTFPAVIFDEEWPKYDGVSQIESGPVPICCELRDTSELYKFVFPRAENLVKTYKKGKEVAVLCLSDDTFQDYLYAGNYRKKFHPITSREELPNIAYAGKRFILSRPEYVAGLQFSAVLLIDVNESESGGETNNLGARRRFASEVYLGASRAEQLLEIYGQKRRGGISSILKFATSSGSIKKVMPSEIKHI